MTAAVNDLLRCVFTFYPVHRVTAECDKKNRRSIAMLERLHFVREGLVRRAEKISDHYVDHLLYGLLKEEYKGSGGENRR